MLNLTYPYIHLLQLSPDYADLYNLDPLIEHSADCIKNSSTCESGVSSSDEFSRLRLSKDLSMARFFEFISL